MLTGRRLRALLDRLQYLHSVAESCPIPQREEYEMLLAALSGGAMEAKDRQALRRRVRFLAGSIERHGTSRKDLTQLRALLQIAQERGIECPHPAWLTEPAGATE